MVQILNKLFSSKQPAGAAAVPPGQRVYAIGDVHGRLDLFARLAEAIERDDRKRGPADTTVVMLGDLVDRGPHSARVLATARAWAKARKVRFISGNHEEMFLLSFYQNDALKGFLKYGGFETLVSYGVDAEELMNARLTDVRQFLHQVVPMEDREFLHGFETMVPIGDYLFVHAGIRPKTPLKQQAGHDCRWIREPFLSHEGDFGPIVVHGHTIYEEVEIRSNRIGIDTGAFRSGKLTALCLEGTERWFIQTQENAGSVETFATAA